MSEDFVQKVRAGLARLRASDPDLTLFGAAAHGYQLHPPATEREVVAFETAHGVVLPASYRRFLLELGNGGAGPHYGLFPLGLWDGRGQGLEPWGEVGAGVLRDPFPHRAHWNLPAERLEPPELEDEDAEEAWQIALERDYWDVALIGGAFPIAHQGCAVRDLLVVTGPRRGHIWVDERASYEGIRPEFTGDGGPLAFEGWYLRWLDEAAQAVGS